MQVARPILAVPILLMVAGSPGMPDAPMEPVLRQYVDHAGFNWVSRHTPHFQLFFETDSDARRYIEVLKRNVEGDRTHVLRLIGVKDYRPTIYAFFLKSGAQMKELVGVEVDGRSRPVQHAIFSVVTPVRLHLTHEICHEIASNVWGAAEPWIEEGLAVYADEGDNRYLYYDAWTLLNSDSLIPLERLVDPEWKSSTYSPDVTYPELGSFVKFLCDRYGVDRVRQIWQGGTESIPQVLGKPLADVEREWRDSLVGQFPERPTRHIVVPADVGSFWMK